VLIVDDNRDMREYLCRLLETDYEVLSASNGEEALACVKDRPPDLVLSDIMMPLLDGFGLLRALRENPDTLTLPVILLSARAGEEARVDGLDAGASDYLVKPFTARELLARIGAQLDMTRIRRQAAAREAELRAEAEAVRDEVSGILESITDAFAVFDRDWRFSYVNTEAERLLGLPREKLLGANHWTLFEKTLGTVVEREYRRAVRDQVAIEFEYHYPPWDKWFLIRGYPTREGGLSNYFRDITGQKHAEAALREQEALREADRRKWREIFFQVPAAVAIMRGPDHVFESFNEEYQRLVARAAEQLYGKPVREVFPEVVPQGYLQLLDGVYRDGIPFTARESLIQLDSAGDGVLRDVYVNFVYNAIRDDRGEITGVFAHIVDVTDLVDARKRIEESEERFRQLAESMPQVVWSTDAKGVIDYVNSRWTELTGCDLHATLAQTYREKMFREDLETLDSAFAESLRTGKAYSVECRFRRVADGTLRWHLVSAVPIRNHRGEVVKWIGTSTDINAQKEANEDLRRANEDLEQFGYSASHDLQEPLRAIAIYSDVLAARYADRLDGQALEMLGFLKSGASRLGVLVRDLLAYTQVKNVDGRQEADAMEAIAAALANLENAIEANSAQVLYGTLPPVRIHRIHLQQLFQNLIGNALKYRSARPPQISVEAKKQDQHWLFSVSDNGIGIDSQYKERIFGLFKRLHTGDEYSGTGIGLAICKRIVEQYRGRIWVESTPGEGSIFYFTIPF
jgi:PAS domain S-box-containing protein